MEHVRLLTCYDTDWTYGYCFFCCIFTKRWLKLYYSLIGKYLATGSGDGTVNIWKMSDFSLDKTLTGHTEAVFSVAFSSDGN